MVEREITSDDRDHVDMATAPVGPPARRGFVRGVLASMPVWLAVVPFGVIFGTVAVDAGLDMVQVMAFTVIVTAGASQLAALQVLTDGAPAVLAVLTGAVVNLRMAMYSASIAAAWPGVAMSWRIPAAWFLHDQAFALSMRRYADRPDEPMRDKLGFYFGVGMATTTVWVIATWVGAAFGQQIPESWGLDFTVAACFIAIAAPMIRGTANIAAATTAAVASVMLVWLPAGVNLVVAAMLGIVIGMIVQARLGPRDGPRDGPRS
ncbi:MAG: AzlC family ABC transporter permease [Pseudomonadota bacterium]